MAAFSLVTSVQGDVREGMASSLIYGGTYESLEERRRKVLSVGRKLHREHVFWHLL